MRQLSKLPLDLLISILLIGSTIYYAARYVDFSIPPLEDAAMLMRYAQHLADGHGIVWNIGEHPVDGATDFLFMVASAALIKLGLTVGQSVRGIGFASHLLTVLIIYWTNHRVNNANIAFFFKRTLSSRRDWPFLCVCLLRNTFLCPCRRIHLDFGPELDLKKRTLPLGCPRLRFERTDHWPDLSGGSHPCLIDAAWQSLSCE